MVLGPVSHWAQYFGLLTVLPLVTSCVETYKGMMFVLGMCSVVDNPCDNL